MFTHIAGDTPSPWFSSDSPAPPPRDTEADAEATVPRFPMPEIMFQQYPKPTVMTETLIPDDEWP